MKIRSLFLNGLANALRSGRVRNNPVRIGFKDDPNDIKTLLSAELEKRDNALTALITKANDEAAKAGKVSADTLVAINATVKANADLVTRLEGLEVELADIKTRKAGGPEARKSVGTQMVESEEFTELVKRGRGTAMLRLKAVNTINSVTGATTGDAGSAVYSDRLPGILTPAIHQLRIRDLLLPGRTSSNSIEYIRESGYQNMAASILEGALKPQSDLTFARAVASVTTLGHWVRATMQILADAPALQSYIDMRMMYGLKLVEDAQLLAGDGTGENLLGLIPQATAFNTALTKTGDTKIDTIRKAILQVRIALYQASAIVMSPNDWADIELQKDNYGRYIWVNVTLGGAPQLWRLPVVDSDAMPDGTFLVGAFNIAAQIFDREDANVQVSTEDQDNFVKNLVTIRCEERLALIVFRPEAFVYGAFPEVGDQPVT